MAHEDWKRNAARALLLTGSNCRDVARTLYVPYATVKRWNKELQEEREGIEQTMLQRCKAPVRS